MPADPLSEEAPSIFSGATARFSVEFKATCHSIVCVVNLPGGGIDHHQSEKQWQVEDGRLEQLPGACFRPGNSGRQTLPRQPKSEPEEGQAKHHRADQINLS